MKEELIDLAKEYITYVEDHNELVYGDPHKRPIKMDFKSFIYWLSGYHDK